MQNIQGDNSVNIINELIEHSRRRDKELCSFIDEYLYPKNSKLSIATIENNINSLKKMTESQRIIVQSRAKGLEDSNDIAKYMPSLLVIIGLIISAYTTLATLFSSEIKVLLPLMATIIFAAMTFRIYVSLMKNRSTAVYFNNLINSLEYDN